MALLKLGKPKGVYHCPAQLHSVTLLAFGYSTRRAVDLWYNDSGCQTLDNGTITAWQVASSVDFGRFVRLVNQLAAEDTDIPVGSS
jgi:hypothetical protein